MTDIDQQVSSRLFDETVRVESIIWIPGAVADPESTPEAFREGFVEDIIDGNSSELLASLPRLKRILKDEDFADTVEIADALLFTPGFLVKLATPIRDFHDGNISSFSWGFYRTGWIYVETEAGLEPAILDWVRTEVERQKAKVEAKRVAAEAR